MHDLEKNVNHALPIRCPKFIKIYRKKPLLILYLISVFLTVFGFVLLSLTSTCVLITRPQSDIDEAILREPSKDVFDVWNFSSNPDENSMQQLYLRPLIEDYVFSSICGTMSVVFLKFPGFFPIYISSLYILGAFIYGIFVSTNSPYSPTLDPHDMPLSHLAFRSQPPHVTERILATIKSSLSLHWTLAMAIMAIILCLILFFVYYRNLYSFAFQITRLDRLAVISSLFFTSYFVLLQIYALAAIYLEVSVVYANKLAMLSLNERYCSCLNNSLSISWSVLQDIKFHLLFILRILLMYHHWFLIHALFVYLSKYSAAQFYPPCVNSKESHSPTDAPIEFSASIPIKDNKPIPSQHESVDSRIPPPSDFSASRQPFRHYASHDLLMQMKYQCGDIIAFSFTAPVVLLIQAFYLPSRIEKQSAFYKLISRYSYESLAILSVTNDPADINTFLKPDLVRNQQDRQYTTHIRMKDFLNRCKLVTLLFIILFLMNPFLRHFSSLFLLSVLYIPLSTLVVAALYHENLFDPTAMPEFEQISISRRCSASSSIIARTLSVASSRSISC